MKGGEGLMQNILVFTYLTNFLKFHTNITRIGQVFGYYDYIMNSNSSKMLTLFPWIFVSI